MKRVLVVDDSATIRQQVSAALTIAGFEVIEATDGFEALSQVRRGVGLVICDVGMPKLDGLTMLEALHADPRWRDVPVLMLTTQGQPELMARARTAGAKGWIVKPFKAELLVAAVRQLAA